VDYEWDPAKARANLKKHGIHLADAASALEDAGAVTVRDIGAHDEERWVTLGTDSLGRVLVVVYTWSRNKIRLISARPGTARERRQYGETHET
jgi:hypothetical protein